VKAKTKQEICAEGLVRALAACSKALSKEETP
jgi:hypothetical protein